MAVLRISRSLAELGYSLPQLGQIILSADISSLTVYLL
nr:MAG TPA: hypothetical protein [Caudoviricetes sp.]DAZ22554.1 MAG TPA: hypothetical protein [Caudoviricetes sp.]